MTDRTGTKYTHLQRYQPIIKDKDGNEVFFDNKLERKLNRQGSLYGHVSIVQQTFNAIQAQKFKDSKALRSKSQG